MRVARNRKELLEGLVAARSEAKAAFGNPTVFLERYIENPKHIEVQILGDNYGNLVHFLSGTAQFSAVIRRWWSSHRRSA